MSSLSYEQIWRLYLSRFRRLSCEELQSVLSRHGISFSVPLQPQPMISSLFFRPGFSPLSITQAEANVLILTESEMYSMNIVVDSRKRKRSHSEPSESPSSSTFSSETALPASKRRKISSRPSSPSFHDILSRFMSSPLSPSSPTHRTDLLSLLHLTPAPPYSDLIHRLITLRRTQLDSIPSLLLQPQRDTSLRMLLFLLLRALLYSVPPLTLDQVFGSLGSDVGESVERLTLLLKTANTKPEEAIGKVGSETESDGEQLDVEVTPVVTPGMRRFGKGGRGGRRTQKKKKAKRRLREDGIGWIM